MKRLLSFLLVIVMVLSALALVACNDNDTAEPDSPAATTTNTPGGDPTPGTPGTGGNNPEPGTPAPGTTAPPFEGDYSYLY